MNLKSIYMKHNKWFWLLLGILFVTVAIYVFRPSVKTETTEGFLFHPDAVVQLNWKIGTKQFEFTRPNRNQDWTPYVLPTLVQRKLVALGTAKLKKMKAPDNVILLQLGFTDKTNWQGVYADNKFVWITGLYAGKGFYADASWRPIFESGQWAFQDLKYNWCAARPMKMNFEIDGDDYEVQFREGRWWINKATIDNTYFEQWLGRNCDFVVDRYYDLGHFSLPPGQGPGDFEVQFENGKKLSWEGQNGYWVVSKQMALKSEKFILSLRELLTFLHTK